MQFQRAPDESAPDAHFRRVRIVLKGFAVAVLCVLLALAGQYLQIRPLATAGFVLAVAAMAVCAVLLLAGLALTLRGR